MTEMQTIRFTAELKLPAGYVNKEEMESMFDSYGWTLVDIVKDMLHVDIPNTRTMLSVKEAEVEE